MAKPSDREYELRRQIKELEDKNKVKDLEIKELKKKLEKLQKPEEYTKHPKKAKPEDCPDCGASVSITELPHGTMQLCKDKCGWRKVINK